MLRTCLSEIYSSSAGNLLIHIFWLYLEYGKKLQVGYCKGHCIALESSGQNYNYGGEWNQIKTMSIPGKASDSNGNKK